MAIYDPIMTGRPAASPATSPATNGGGAGANHGRPQNARRQAGNSGTQRDPESEGSKLTVGRNIHLSGEITACDTLVVEGRVEASMNSRIIEISETGVFTGQAVIDSAYIRGRFDGNLTVRKCLVIDSTGEVVGDIRYGEISIEPGGQISGKIETIDPAEISRAGLHPTAQPSAAKTRDQEKVSRKAANDRAKELASKNPQPNGSAVNGAASPAE